MKNKIKEQIANNAKELIEGFVPSLYQKIDQMNEKLKSSLLLLKVAQEYKYDTKTKTDYMEELMNACWNIGLAKCSVDSVSNELRNLTELISESYENYELANDKEMAMATEWFRENYKEAKDEDLFFHFVNENFDEIFYDEFLKELVDPRDIKVFTKKAKELFEESYEEYVQACKENREKHFTKNQFKEDSDWKSYVVVYQVKNGEIVPVDNIKIF